MRNIVYQKVTLVLELDADKLGWGCGGDVSFGLLDIVRALIDRDGVNNVLLGDHDWIDKRKFNSYRDGGVNSVFDKNGGI